MATFAMGSRKPNTVDVQLRARRAQFALNFSRRILWVAGPLGAGILIVGMIAAGNLLLLLSGGLILQLAGCMWLYSFLHRRGRPGIGAYLIVFSMELSAVGFFLISRDIGLGILPGYMVIMTILIANLILDDQRSRLVTGLMALLLVAAAVILPSISLGGATPTGKAATILTALIATAPFLLASTLIYQLVRDQDAFFRDSRLASWEIGERIAAELEQRDHLQQINLELERRSSAEYQQRKQLQEILARVRDASTDLNSTSTEILSATSQQVAGASEQAVAINQMMSIIDEVRGIAEHTVTQAQDVAGGAQRSLEYSRAGQSAVQRSIESVMQIQIHVETIAKNVISLSEHTERIGQIIVFVNDLASQSNMLALNASVEAARAGAEGKGFSVVAEEVRQLADQSRRATTEIRTILSDILQAIRSTGDATEQGAARVEAGVEAATQMGESIQLLGSMVIQSAQAAMQMVAGGQQQTAGIEQIASAMLNITQTTEQSMASTRQVGRAARNLNSLARSLAGSVEQYQKT